MIVNLAQRHSSDRDPGGACREPLEGYYRSGNDSRHLLECDPPVISSYNHPLGGGGG